VSNTRTFTERLVLKLIKLVLL